MLTQTRALTRMEAETRRELRRFEDNKNDELLALWRDTQSKLRLCIFEHYRRDFSGKEWDLVTATARGTLRRISDQAANLLAEFLKASHVLIGDSLAAIRQEEKLRALWMIDQTTPESYVPKRPAREADSPRDAKASWRQALNAWMDIYHTNLNTNLKMEALHEGEVKDAMDEVSATRIDNHDPAYKLRSMFATEAIMGEADARREIFDANEDMQEIEIWQTMEDGIVCEICEEYDGKPLDEVPDDIPAHYNCRCYTRFVPLVYSKMLSSGDDDERDLARRMDDAGLAGDSMPIISDKTGRLIGRGVVTFSDWKAERGNIVGIAR